MTGGTDGSISLTVVEDAGGTQFTCFTSTTVQNLTPEELLQVSNSRLRFMWLHSPLPGGAVDRSALRLCGMASSSWTRPALAGVMVLLEDGSLQHLGDFTSTFVLAY